MPNLELNSGKEGITPTDNYNWKLLWCKRSIQVRGLRSARIDNRRDCCPWQEEPNGDGIKRKSL